MINYQSTFNGRISSIGYSKINKRTGDSGGPKMQLVCESWSSWLITHFNYRWLFFFEFTLDEALKLQQKKTTQLNGVADGLTKDEGKINAHNKFVWGVREIQLIEDSPDTKPQRDIFNYNTCIRKIGLIIWDIYLIFCIPCRQFLYVFEILLLSITIRLVQSKTNITVLDMQWGLS